MDNIQYAEKETPIVEILYIDDNSGETNIETLNAISSYEMLIEGDKAFIELQTPLISEEFYRFLTKLSKQNKCVNVKAIHSKRSIESYEDVCCSYDLGKFQIETFQSKTNSEDIFDMLISFKSIK